MERVGEHPVPVGPLAVRWLAHEIGTPRAGARTAMRVALHNAGSATWRTRGTQDGIFAAYHWLDELGNPIVWDGARAPLPHPVAPGDEVELELAVRAPIPPGPYRLVFDLIEEHRFWFAELGNRTLEQRVPVAPRVERTLAVDVAPGPADLLERTSAALARQHEAITSDGAAAVARLAAGCEPAPDWSRLVLDAHQAGFAAVAGAVRRRSPALLRRREATTTYARWRPEADERPVLDAPLLCPSVVTEAAADIFEDEGLPAAHPPRDEPWVVDPRIEVTAPARSGRRRA